MDQDIIKVFNKAKAIAIKYGFEDCADDYAGDVALRALEYERQGRCLFSIEKAVIDCIRKQYGRTRLPGGKQRLSRRGMQISTEQPLGCGSKATIGDTLISGDSDTRCESGYTVFGLGTIEAALCIGSSAVEIAIATGLSESRVSQKKNYSYAATRIWH
jgi:hypothetical protein